MPFSSISRYCRMVRIEHTLFSVPMALSGLLLADPNPPIPVLGWVLAAVFGARTGAMGLNRLIDRKIDAANPRTQNRVLPQKLVSARGTIILILMGFILYFVAAFKLSRTCGLLAPLPILLFMVYPYMKRWTMFCHLGIGVALGLSPMGGFLASTKTLVAAVHHPHFPVLITLAVFVTLWVGSFDVYYAILDETFDRQASLYALPARIGRVPAAQIAATGHLVGFIYLAYGVLRLRPSLLFAIPGLAGLAAMLTAEYVLVRRNLLESAFFNINIAVSLAVFVLIYGVTLA